MAVGRAAVVDGLYVIARHGTCCRCPALSKVATYAKWNPNGDNPIGYRRGQARWSVRALPKNPPTRAIS